MHSKRVAMTEAYVLGGVRTPFTRYGGTLSGIRADDLLGMTMKGACDRLGVPLGAVEDIVAGCVNPAHEGMGDVARWAALAAGFPDTAAGATVNRFCVAAIRLAATFTRGVRRVPEIDSRWWR
jgi:acetyl-CoA acetyltransferase